MSFAAHALTHRTLRRRHWIGLVLLLTVLIWGGLWSLAALRFNKTVDAWAEAARAGGATLSFKDRSTDGSPWAVHVHLEDFAWEKKGADALRADEAILYLSVLDWSLISAKLKGTITGVFKGLPFKSDTFKFGLMRPSTAPINNTEAGLFLWVHAIGLTPETEKPLPLGPRIDELSVDLRVMGDVPDFSDEAAVQAWNEASGVIEFDHLGLRWGPMNLAAKGTLALAANLQPEGAFSARVEGLEATLDRMIRAADLAPKQEALLHSAVTVLARPASVMGGETPIVPISLQNGGLFIGPVRVMPLPELMWR